MSGVSGNLLARYNSAIVTPVWSIISGSGYASISSDGTVTIISDGTITVAATYSGLIATKDIDVVYVADTQTETVVTPDGSVTTTTTTTTTDQETGETVETQVSSTTNPDGTSSTTNTTTTTDPVTGGSTSTSVTNNSDGTSSENETVTNSDGSYNSSTTNYDSNGDPESTSNVEGDTDGNVSTQDIEYDENGNSTVVGYTIDTSANSDGVKSFNNTGVNTDFYGFDVTGGFEVYIHFTMNFSNQPYEIEGHHNILTMKRTKPEPWYGFHIRHSHTNKNVQLGTQFSTGGNTNTTINPPRYVTTNVAEYNIRILYDPLVSSNKFQCWELISNKRVYSSNYVFPDLPELRYLRVCVGFALDENGNPFRYGIIDVLNFSINKLNR